MCVCLFIYIPTLCACLDVKQIPEVFQSLSSLDKRLEKVRAIMLTPRCSVSAVSNPVELILQENGGTCRSVPTMKL